jgi:hypothetical protein
VRLQEDEARRPGFLLREPTLLQTLAAETLAAEHPGLVLRWGGMSGSPKWVAPAPGDRLSAPAPHTPEKAARNFLRSLSSLLGVHAGEIDGFESTSVVPAPDGGAHVYFTQRVAGLEVHGGRVNVNLDAKGAVRSFGSELYAGASPAGAARIDAEQAVRLATRSVYSDLLFEGTVREAADEGERLTVFDAPGFGDAPRARLVLFPEREGARLSWEVQIAAPDFFTEYLVLLDAMDGSILWRRNLIQYADARVVPIDGPRPRAEEYTPDVYELMEVPAVTAESPLGWITGDGTVLAGNNAEARLLHNQGPVPSSPTAVYDYPFNTMESASTNAWWWANEFHDRLYLAIDRDSTYAFYYSDHVVEAGIDNVHVEADRQYCDLSGIDPPNPVGNTLRVNKAGPDAELAWQEPPADASHDPVAYYDVYVSGRPDAGFAVDESTQGPSTRRPLDSTTEYIAVVSVNAAGASGEEPVP